jgi:hypothetical protein
MKWLVCVLALAGCACSRSNNLLLGRVESPVGGHRVIVTDCYRTTVPPPEKTGASEYRFTPCRDADVHIRNEVLEVNGRKYGALKPNDTVLVDHGVVSVNPRE